MKSSITSKLFACKTHAYVYFCEMCPKSRGLQ